MKTIITSLLLITIMSIAQGQIAPSWVRYSTPSNYQNYDAKEVSTGTDTVGNIYTAASMMDTVNNLYKAMLVKYNSGGTEKWKVFFDNNDPNYNGTNVVTLLVDKIGNCYVCGYGINNSTSGRDFMILKYDNAGNFQWSTYWDGGQSQNDYATCAMFDKSGNIIVGGYVNSFGTTGDDMAVIKVSPAGTFFWSYTFNNSAVNDEDRVLALASDNNNNIYLTGSTYGVSSNRDMISMKLDSNGLNKWISEIPHVTTGADERGYGIAADNTGHCYVTGSVGDWTTIKYDSLGNSIWTNHDTTNSLDRFITKKVMLDKFNNVIVVGDAFISSANQTDLVVNKINNGTGNSIWYTSYNNAGIDNFEDAVLDTNANVYVTGSFEGPLNIDMSAMIISPNGSVIWHTTFTNSLNISGGDMPYQITLDKNRSIILAGVAETRGNTSNDVVDVVTLKFPTSITGINSVANETAIMNIYPNPAKDNLTITISDESLIGSTVKIINIMGAIVSEEKIISLSQQFNLSNLSNGIYMVNFSNGKESFSKKIIIE